MAPSSSLTSRTQSRQWGSIQRAPVIFHLTFKILKICAASGCRVRSQASQSRPRHIWLAGIIIHCLRISVRSRSKNRPLAWTTAWHAIDATPLQLIHALWRVSPAGFRMVKWVPPISPATGPIPRRYRNPPDIFSHPVRSWSLRKRTTLLYRHLVMTLATSLQQMCDSVFPRSNKHATNRRLHPHTHWYKAIEMREKR